jgi:hypothetical protein
MTQARVMALRHEGREASERLTRALITLASSGQRPHCSQPEVHNYWTSEART